MPSPSELLFPGLDVFPTSSIFDQDAIGDETFTSLQPLVDKYGTSLDLLVYARAIGGMFQQVDDIAKDGDEGQPGWSQIFDRARAKDEWLFWLGQMVGYRVPALAATDTQAQWSDRERTRIQTRSAHRRATVDVLREVVQEYLIAPKTVLIQERTGSAHQINVYVFDAQLAPSPYPPNVIVNPGADQLVGVGSTTGWTPNVNNDTGGNFISSTDFARNGARSFKTIRDTTSAGGGGMTHATKPAMSAGQYFECRAAFLAAATPRICTFGVNYYDASDVFISAEPNPPQIQNTITDWTDVIYLGGPAPPGTAKVQLLVIVSPISGNVPAGEVQYIDSVAMYIANTPFTSPLPYYDGDSPGWHWLTTPPASSSEFDRAAVVKAAAMSQKAAGLIMNFTVLSGATYTVFQASNATNNIASGKHANYNSVLTNPAL